MTAIPASKQYWYTATDKQFTHSPVLHTGPANQGGTAFLFVDFAGKEVGQTTPIGKMGFNAVGKAFMYGEDNGEWFRRYMTDIGEWMGSRVIPIFRYATGAYGAVMVGGRLHRALHAMMSTAWLHGPNAQHNLLHMTRIKSICKYHGINFGVYHGTPAFDEAGPSTIANVQKVVRAWDNLGVWWHGFDYVSGRDSTAGQPADRAFPKPSEFWPDGANITDGFRHGPREKLWADGFMLDMHATAPSTPMCAESGLDPGRAMYEKVGMLRMITPNTLDDITPDGGARFGIKSTERLTGEARDYEVCNPGVPQYNLFDGGGHWSPEEYKAMLRVVRALPGDQRIGATCWVPGTVGGPNIYDYYKGVKLYTDANGGG